MKSTRCLICGRLLTNSKSVERGIGPVCRARLLKEYKTEEAEDSG
uniref:Uncharacterized protein n=1 Tax=viral metagenome TaxID=1070528 RepID=A0A6M3M795_9ZZZZ